MEIAEIHDREVLEQYLLGLPHDELRAVAARVAFRSSARVLPIGALEYTYANAQSDTLKNAAKLFGSVLIAAVAATATSNAVGHYEPEVSEFGGADSARSHFASLSAAISTRVYPHAAATADHAEHSFVAFEYGSSSRTDSFYFWNMICDDLRSDKKRPLWDGQPPQKMRHAWQAVKTDMIAVSAVDWSFWIAWYERVLSGRDFLPDEIGFILSRLGQEDWEKGPAHINPLFDGVLAQYRAQDVAAVVEATPLGEEVVLDDAHGVLVLQPTDQVQADYLEVVHAQIASALRIFDSADPTKNSLPLSAELRILQDAISLHGDRPVLILKDVTRVLGRVARKVENGECPSREKDADVYDFQDILETVQLDLIGLSPEVQEYHAATRPAVPIDGVPQLADGARAVALAGDDAFASALNEAADVLEDDGADEAMRRNAFYRLSGLVARGAVAARGGLGKTASLVKDVTTVVGAVGTVGGVAWFASPAFQEFMRTVIKAFGL